MGKNKQILPLEKQLEAPNTMPDTAIAFSDIPEILDWEGAERDKFYRPIKNSVTLRLDADVLKWFKYSHPKYRTAINAALREYVVRQG